VTCRQSRCRWGFCCHRARVEREAGRRVLGAGRGWARRAGVPVNLVGSRSTTQTSVPSVAMPWRLGVLLRLPSVHEPSSPPECCRRTPSCWRPPARPCRRQPCWPHRAGRCCPTIDPIRLGQRGVQPVLERLVHRRVVDHRRTWWVECYRSRAPSPAGRRRAPSCACRHPLGNVAQPRLNFFAHAVRSGVQSGERVVARRVGGRGLHNVKDVCCAASTAPASSSRRQ